MKLNEMVVVVTGATGDKGRFNIQKRCKENSPDNN